MINTCFYCGGYKYLNTVGRNEYGQGAPCRFCNYEEYLESEKEKEHPVFKVIHKEDNRETFRGIASDCHYWIYLADNKEPHSRKKYKICLI